MLFETREGQGVWAQRANRRHFGGPTIRTDAELRRVRDMMILLMRQKGFNAHDCELVFGISTRQVNRRLKEALKGTYPYSSRRGI